MKGRLKEFSLNVINILKRPYMSVLPGQLAFFFVLSVVPIVTLITYMASFLHLPVDFLGSFVTKAFGSNVASLIEPYITSTTIDIHLFITILVGFAIASNGASSIIITSNQIYGIKDSSFLRRRIKAIIMTILIVILFIFILIVPVFGNKIIDLFTYVNLNEHITKTLTFTINILKGPFSWLITFIFIKLLYTLAPDRVVDSSYTTIGAVFTSVMWIFATSIYSYYVNHFANYTLFYGGLASIVMLMLWVYLLAYIFTIGLALNYKKEEEQTSTYKIVK